MSDAELRDQITALDKRVDRVEMHIDALRRSEQNTDARLDGLSKKFDALSGEFHKFANRLSEVVGQIGGVKWMVGVGLALSTLFLSFVVWVTG